MKWFKHDSNAHRDAKLRKVVMRYKADGYALYWYCIELIASRLDKDNISFELEDDAEIIAYDLGIDSTRVQEIMVYMVELGLFDINPETQRIVCLKLANRLDESASKNPQIRKVVNAARESGLIQAKSSGYVYLMESDSIYKIGMTTNLHNRLSDFKTTNPKATLVHTIESVDPHLLESSLHKHFKELKVDGEWFDLSSSDVEKILSIRDGDRFIREGFPTASRPDKIRLDKTRLDNKNNTSIGQADKPLVTKIPYKQIVSAYHEELPTLAKVAVLSDKRKNAIKKIFNHHENHKSLDWWREYFQYVSSSEFLTNPSESSTNPNWRADFEWLTNFNNFVKIIEGKYHHAA